jgi:hypothetical protein
VDDAAVEKMGCVRGELAGIGPYRLADAYADSLLVAAHYSPSLPEAIYFVAVQALVRLPAINHHSQG